MSKYVYVANYRTYDDLLCDQDDNPARNESLTNYAAPQLLRVFAEWDSVAYARCRQDVQDELNEMYEGDEEELFGLRWVEGEFQKPDFGYEYAVFEAYCTKLDEDGKEMCNDDELHAVVVVQKRPLE